MPPTTTRTVLADAVIVNEPAPGRRGEDGEVVATMYRRGESPTMPVEEAQRIEREAARFGYRAFVSEAPTMAEAAAIATPSVAPRGTPVTGPPHAVGMDPVTILPVDERQVAEVLSNLPPGVTPEQVARVAAAMAAASPLAAAGEDPEAFARAVVEAGSPDPGNQPGPIPYTAAPGVPATPFAGATSPVSAMPGGGATASDAQLEAMTADELVAYVNQHPEDVDRVGDLEEGRPEKKRRKSVLQAVEAIATAQAEREQ